MCAMVLFLAGCGSVESRVVNQSCRGYLDDDQVNQAIHGIAADYLDGVPYSAQIYAVQEYCGGHSECQNCLFALVDVVYSQ